MGKVGYRRGIGGEIEGENRERKLGDMRGEKEGERRIGGGLEVEKRGIEGVTGKNQGGNQGKNQGHNEGRLEGKNAK